MLHGAFARALAFFAVFTAGVATAEEPTFDQAQTEAIEKIAREYILTHPEIVQQALQIADAQRLVLAEKSLAQAILARRDLLVNDPGSPSVGGAGADVTVVEFLDFRCGFCRRAAPIVKELLFKDTNVRFVFKDFPILGPDSVAAARIALAAHRQDQARYAELHDAIYTTDGPIDEAGVLALAASLGLDVERLKADMNDPEIDAIIARNEQLAQQLDIRGTPTFVIGTKILPGFSTIEQLQAAVAEERSRIAATKSN